MISALKKLNLLLAFSFLAASSSHAEQKLISSTVKGYDSLPVTAWISAFFGERAGSLVISPEGKLFARKEGVFKEGAAGLESSTKDGYQESFVSTSRGAGNYSLFHSRQKDNDKAKKESEALLIENNQVVGKISCLGADTDNCVAVNNLVCSDLKIQLGSLDADQLKNKFISTKGGFESKVSETYNKNLGNSQVTKLSEKLDPILKKGSGRSFLESTHIEMESLRSEKLLSGFLLKKCAAWDQLNEQDRLEAKNSESKSTAPKQNSMPSSNTSAPTQFMDGTGKN